MNWEAISAISEAGGVLAVIVTLGYLAVQIRYARIAVTDENRLARSEGVRGMLLAMAHMTPTWPSCGSKQQELKRHINHSVTAGS